jgi:hypothetical protein
VTKSDLSPAVRRLRRGLALVPAALLVTSATPAFATAPEQWGETPSVDPLHALLVIVLIPLGLFLLIALLTYLPSMIRGESAYRPGLAWRHEPEWFGGPREGLEKADRTDPEALEGAGQRGGASGHW